MCVGGGDTEFGWRSPPEASQSWRIANAIEVHEYPACPYEGQVLRSRSRLLILCRRRGAPEKRILERRREIHQGSRRKSEALKARNGTRALSSWGMKPSARFAPRAGLGMLCDPGRGARPSGRAPISRLSPSRRPLKVAISLSDSRPQSCTGRSGGRCKLSLNPTLVQHARMDAARASERAPRRTPATRALVVTSLVHRLARSAGSAAGPQRYAGRPRRGV